MLHCYVNNSPQKLSRLQHLQYILSILSVLLFFRSLVTAPSDIATTEDADDEVPGEMSTMRPVGLPLNTLQILEVK